MADLTLFLVIPLARGSLTLADTPYSTTPTRSPSPRPLPLPRLKVIFLTTFLRNLLIVRCSCLVLNRDVSTTNNTLAFAVQSGRVKEVKKKVIFRSKLGTRFENIYCKNYWNRPTTLSILNNRIPVNKDKQFDIYLVKIVSMYILSYYFQ